jgi:hypothetical protein
MSDIDTLCWNCNHRDGDHDEKECMGGQDTICRCPGFVSSEEAEENE